MAAALVCGSADASDRRSVVATLRDVRFALIQSNTPGYRTMSSTTVSVRIDPVIKKRLEKLAKSTGRSRSFLAAAAINEYLDLNEWQVAGVQKAISSFDEGRGVSHRQVKDWVSSWNGKKERPRPRRPTT